MSLEEAFNLFHFSFLKPAPTKWLSIYIQQRFYYFRAGSKACWVNWTLQRSLEQALLQDKGKLWFVWILCRIIKIPLFIFYNIIRFPVWYFLFLWTEFGHSNIPTQLNNNDFVYVHIYACTNSNWRWITLYIFFFLIQPLEIWFYVIHTVLTPEQLSTVLWEKVFIFTDLIR